MPLSFNIITGTLSQCLAGNRNIGPELVPGLWLASRMYSAQWLLFLLFRDDGHSGLGTGYYDFLKSGLQ